MKIFRGTIVLCIILFASGISQEKIKMPTSTVVTIKSARKLTGKMLKTGQELVLDVALDVVVNGKKLIKAGTPVICVVEDAEGAGMVGQAGKLSISIQSTTAVDGSTIALRGNLFTKGESKTGTSVAVGVVLCPLALLCKGEEGDIPAGAQARSLTIAEYEIAVTD